MQIKQKHFRETNGVIWENTKLIGHELKQDRKSTRMRSGDAG